MNMKTDNFDYLEESVASQTAKSQGFNYIGYGRYINPRDKQLFKSDGTRLIPYSNKAAVSQDNQDIAGQVKPFGDTKDVNSLIENGHIKLTQSYEQINEAIYSVVRKNAGITDFVKAFVPDDIYKKMGLQVNFESEKTGKDVTINIDGNGYNSKKTIKKIGKGLVAFNNNEMLPESVQGSGLIRKSLYNTINLYQRLGIDAICQTSGNSEGSYAWAKYGFDYSSSKERDKFLNGKGYDFGVSGKINNLLRLVESKTKDNDEAKNLVKWLKEAKTKFTNSKTSWDMSNIAIKLNKKEQEILSKIVEEYENAPYIMQQADSYKVIKEEMAQDDIFKFGKYFMRGGAYNSKLSLQKNSESYKQFYNYMNYKGKRYDVLNEAVEPEKNIDIPEDTNMMPLCQEINGRKTDRRIWRMDKFDTTYEQENLKVINSGK